MYAVLHKGEVIDVLDKIQYVKYQERNNIIIPCKDKEYANGVMSSDGNGAYHLEEFPKFGIEGIKTVRLRPLSLEETEAKLSEMETGQNKEITLEYSLYLVSVMRKKMDDLIDKVDNLTDEVYYLKNKLGIK